MNEESDFETDWCNPGLKLKFSAVFKDPEKGY